MRKITSNGGGAAAIAEPHQQMLLRLGETNHRVDISAARRVREKEELQQLLEEKQQQQQSEAMKCTRENRGKLLEFGVPLAADIFEAATSTGDGGIDIGNNESSAETFWSSVLPVAHASSPLHATEAADQQQQQQDADRQIEIQQQTELLLQQQKQDEDDKNQQNYSNMQWSTANISSNDAAPRDHLSATATLTATPTAAAAAAIVAAQPQGAAATTQGKEATVAAIQAAVIRAEAVQPSATSEAAATATTPAGGEDEILHEAAASAGEDVRADIGEDNEARVKVEEIIKEASNDSTAAATSLAAASPAAASLLDYERQLDAWVVMTDTDVGCGGAAGGVTAADLSGRTAATADVIMTAAAAATTAAAEDAAAETAASFQGDCFPGIKQGEDTRTVTAATPTIAAASLTVAAAGDGLGNAIAGEEGIAGETNDSKSETDAVAIAALKAKAAASRTAATAVGTAGEMREEGGRAAVKEGGAPRAVANEGKTIEKEKISICASGTSQHLQECEEETRITKDDKSDVWKPWWSSLFKITALTEKKGSLSSGSSKGGGRSPVAGAVCRGGESKQKQQQLKTVVVGGRGASSPKQQQQQQQQEEGIAFSTGRAGVFSCLQQQKRDVVEVVAAAKEQRDMRIEGSLIKNNCQKSCWCFSNSEEKQFDSKLYTSMPSSPTSAAAALCRPGEGCAAALSCPPSPIYYSSSAPSTGSGSCLSSIRVYTPSLPTPVLSRGLSSAAAVAATQHTVLSSCPAASAAGRCWNPSSATDILSPTSSAASAAVISSAFLPAAADEEASPCDDSAFLSVDEQQLDMVFDKLLLSSAAATAAAGGSPSSPIGIRDRAAATAARHTATIQGGSQSRQACVVTASHINSKADNSSPVKADNSSPVKADNSFSDKADNSFSDKADNSFSEKAGKSFSEKADSRYCEKADSLCLSSLFTSRVLTLDMKSPAARAGDAAASTLSSPFGDSPATTAAATGEDDSSFEEKDLEQQDRHIENNNNKEKEEEEKEKEKDEKEEEEIRHDEEGNEGGFGATLREKTLQLQQHLQRLHQGILDRDLPTVRLAIADLAEFGGPEVSGVWAGVKVGMGIATVATGHALVGGLMLAMATGAVGSAVIWGRHREYFRSWVVGMQAPQSSQLEEEEARGGEEEATGGEEEARGGDEEARGGEEEARRGEEEARGGEEEGGRGEEGGGGGEEEEEEIAVAAAIVAAAAASEENEKREAYSHSSSSNSNSLEIHATDNLAKTTV